MLEVSCAGSEGTFLPVSVLQHLVLSLPHAAAEPVCALPFRRSKCDSDPRTCVLVQHRHWPQHPTIQVRSSRYYHKLNQCPGIYFWKHYSVGKFSSWFRCFRKCDSKPLSQTIRLFWLWYLWHYNAWKKNPKNKFKVVSHFLLKFSLFPVFYFPELNLA